MNSNLMSECVINFENVMFSYNEKENAVDDLTMCIHRGQSLAILGHNGAGKTTTLRLILGLLHPQQGRILVNGLAPDSPLIPRGMIAYMPETGGIYDRLTGFQNLVFRARAANVDPTDIHARSTFWLEKLGLLQRGDEKVGYWSKGLKQRLSLACALICNPRLLLLDEPTNGLDPESLSIVMKVLQETNAQETTLLICSHDLNAVQQVCNQMIIIQYGRLLHMSSIEDATPELLREKYLELTTTR
ncbi:MAG: ABC transporter ATP-binding protein [Anaerolineales bacterium]|nr:ABC transporter ATP-binding protein [Anaerolineales bacterium]MCB8950887.1 ABC transporter ATP-binding protein [Ardenticatenales bacterium]